jgi:hypothetical protein
MGWGVDSFATIGMGGEWSPEKADAMKPSIKILVLGVAAIALAGCASRRGAPQGSMPPPPPPRAVFPPPGAIIVPPGGGPPGAFPTAPNQAPPPGPTNAPPFPQSSPPGPSSQFPVAPPPAPSSSIAPVEARERVGYRWEPAAPPATPPSVLLLPPTPEPGSPEPPRQEPRKQLYPPQQSKEPAVSNLPVGIAAFDRARDNVATGQRPSLEGLDWLQKSNYRVVIFLHPPGEAIDADRQQVEKRGMIFVPIEINPRDLSRNAVERFLRLQAESRNEKIFVYDLDGSLAGAMWYLSFRLIDQDSDEIARIKAGSLGQGENRDASRDIWQAARKYVEQK